MQYTREQAVERLLGGYEAYYNICRNNGEVQLPLVARCDYFEETERYVIFRKAQIWSADCEDFLYVFSVNTLTPEIFNACREYAWKDGESRGHFEPGHMYSYVTIVFVTDSADDEIRRTLKKSHDTKSFRHNLDGWMTLRSVLVTAEEDAVCWNWAGRQAGKVVESVLYKKPRKRRGTK